MLIVDGVDRSGRSLNSYQLLVNQLVKFIVKLKCEPDEIHLGMLWIGDKMSRYLQITWLDSHLQRMINFLKTTEMDKRSGQTIGSPSLDALKMTPELMLGHNMVFNRSQVPNLIVFFSNGNYDDWESISILKEAASLRRFAHVVTVSFGATDTTGKTLLKKISNCHSYTTEIDGLENLQSQLALLKCD